jgi:hypothetical protein
LNTGTVPPAAYRTLTGRLPAAYQRSARRVPDDDEKAH